MHYTRKRSTTLAHGSTILGALYKNHSENTVSALQLWFFKLNSTSFWLTWRPGSWQDSPFITFSILYTEICSNFSLVLNFLIDLKFFRVFLFLIFMSKCFWCKNTYRDGIQFWKWLLKSLKSVWSCLFWKLLVTCRVIYRHGRCSCIKNTLT